MDKNASRILPDAKIEGHVVSDVPVRLEGVVEGNIRCKDWVAVCAGGRVQGDVECDTLLLDGIVTGNVTAKRTVLTESAGILGFLKTGSLEIAEGARIEGGLRLEKELK